MKNDLINRPSIQIQLDEGGDTSHIVSPKTTRLIHDNLPFLKTVNVSSGGQGHKTSKTATKHPFEVSHSKLKVVNTYNSKKALKI